jgi:BirA family biotin operon repressor/biotin-[acetyl-CoA-carboxylase] ligase
MTPKDQIDLTRIRSALVGTRFNGQFHHFSTIASTSSKLLADIATGALEGTVYFADEQTAGRGRGNHVWHSAPCEGLYLSALVRPILRADDALLLSLATGLAVQQAILEVTTLEVDLRWPNDLMLAAPDVDEKPNGKESSLDKNPSLDDEFDTGEVSDGGEKKLGGILVESSVEPGRTSKLRYAVIGIGINVHQTSFPPELEPIATSLHIAERNRRDDPDDVLPLFRAPILISLLRALDLELLSLERDPVKGRAQLLARFSAASTWVQDKRVRVSEQGGYTGITAGLDARGFLLVDSADGRRRTVLSGGVRGI